MTAMREAVEKAFLRAPSPQAPSPHAGLLLQRGLADQQKAASNGGELTAQADLLGRVADVSSGALYRDAFQRRRLALDHDPTTRSAELQAIGSLLVGAGNESVLEVGVTLHHTYGVPFIPGSALKGLARRATTRLGAELLPGGLYHQALFGSPEGASYLVFHDAWYVPGSAPGDQPLAVDVLTPHHPKYYTQAADRRAPWDFDDPNPVSFVSARGSFLITIGGPTAEWSAFTLALVCKALAEDGAGGKTAAGYGRLVKIDQPPVTSAAEAVQGSAIVPPARMEHPLIGRASALASNRVKPEIANLVESWRGITDAADKAAAARALLAAGARVGDRKWLDSRPWAAELHAYLAAQAGLDGQ